MGSGLSGIERLSLQETQCYFANRTFVNQEMFDGHKSQGNTIKIDVALSLFKEADIYFLYEWPITKDSMTKYEQDIILRIKEINNSLKLRGLVTSSMLLDDNFECDNDTSINIENCHCFIFFISQSYVSILQDMYDSSSACKVEFEKVKQHIEKRSSVIFIVFEKKFLDRNILEDSLGLEISEEVPILDFTSSFPDAAHPSSSSTSWDDLCDSLFLAVCSIHSPVMSTYYPPFASSYYQECAVNYSLVEPALPLSIRAPLPIPKSVTPAEEVAEQLVEGNVLLVSLNPEEVATILQAITLGQYSAIFLRDQINGKALCYPNKCDKLEFVKMLSLADYELLLSKISEFKKFGVPTSLLLPVEDEDELDDNFPVNGIQGVTTKRRKNEDAPPAPCYSLFPKFASDENSAFLITSNITSGSGSTGSTEPSVPSSLEPPVCHRTQKTYDQMSILRGHKDFVTCVIISSNHPIIISGSVDKTIIIWNSDSLALQNTLVGHSTKITALCLYDDDLKLLSGSADGQLLIWDVALGVVLQDVATARHSIVSISLVVADFNNNKCNNNSNSNFDTSTTVSIGTNNDINSTTNEKAVSISSHTTGNANLASNTVTGSTGTNHFVLCSKSHIEIIDASNFNIESVWETTEGIICSCVHQNSALLATGSVSGVVSVWSLQKGRLLSSWAAHHEAIYAVSFSGSASGECIRVITGSRDCTILLWDLESQSMLLRMSGHERAVSSLFVSAASGRILSASWDQSLRIWGLATGKLQVVLQGHYGDVVSACMSGDESFVVSGSYDKTVRIWR